MIEHKGVFYYSCTEIAKMINQPDEDFKSVSDKFHQVYSKGYVYDSYVQKKLYPAAEKKYIRYIKYQKKGPKVYKAFAVADLLDFLNRKDARNIEFDISSVRNIEIMEKI